MVVANILAGPLVELAETLITSVKIGGQICLSGLLVNQAKTVTAAYNDYITFDPVKEKDEWALVSGTRVR